MFQIGDKVAHPMHGAGVVDSIVEKQVNGVTRQYYILKLPVRAMVVMVPTQHSGQIGVRPIVDAQQADQILSAIPGLPVDEAESWNRRYRRNLERMKSGDLLQVARVIKNLAAREKMRGLSTGERKMLHSARQILLSELVMSKNGSYEELERQLHAAMQ